MLPRFCLAFALLTCACGEPGDGGDPLDTGGSSGTTGGAEATAGGWAGVATGGSEQNAAGASAGGPALGGGGSAALGGSGGTAEPTAGQPGAAGSGGAVASSGGNAGASQTGGQAGSSSQGGQAGSPPQGGTGGQAVDPLDPKPLEGCPGYVEVFVPHGSCVWFHGSFTNQSKTCSVVNPSEKTCATASAVSADTSVVVSESAEIERFEFDSTGCPKKCN